jgi:hypothetical protein
MKGSEIKRLSLIMNILFLLSYAAGGQESPYKSGEKVNYLVHYGLINGGVATFELYRDTLEGKEILHSIFSAKTTGVADAIFKVRDVYESFMDPKTELPVKSIRNIQEGRYRRYNEVMFDHKTRPDSAILTSDLSGKHITIQGIHDILSCFYYLRKHYLTQHNTLKKGEIITITTWFCDELYPIRLRYVGTDEVRTKIGKINCYQFNPVTEVGRLFKTEEDASLWFSADYNYLPVKARFDIFVGAFTVDLVSYKGLAY